MCVCVLLIKSVAMIFSTISYLGSKHQDSQFNCYANDLYLKVCIFYEVTTTPFPPKNHKSTSIIYFCSYPDEMLKISKYKA